MNFISVCKNAIAHNNKRNWKGPDLVPAIRISRTPQGKATAHANKIAILDENGKIVAFLQSTTNGEPLLKCGAKVALTTLFDVEIQE